MKALTLTLCMGFSLIKACSYNIPSICTNNSVTRYETPASITYIYEEERCTFNKDNNSYEYTTRGFPPSQAQKYYTRRFEALKQQFENKK